ncbi:hypothetical protein KUTeg_019718 [Tegillarca granosa]|uniref:Tyrosinase copper-binding domain-containing protein n=1 Tax=Tegillarca granosa TaxID=220873 RepID=A0ABQ9EDE6_TEGGR|nr:hypothetical protein KUTeg_019718 [Tegillarca granosa]
MDMRSYLPFLSLVPVAFFLCPGNCLIKSIRLPQPLNECFQRKTMYLNVTEIPGHAINSFCLNTYKSKQVDVHQELDVPKDIFNWIRSLLRKFISARRKRQVFPVRIRKEIRALSETERRDYFRAVLALKADTSIAPNKWDALASKFCTKIQNAVFFITKAEEALRTKVPHVTIPYWDSTKDFDMPDPVMSVVWTSQFFGNGDGIVTSGPFANWITGDNEPLIRNIGSSGMLMSRQGVRNILAQTFHYEITEGTAVSPENSIEIQHNAVHNWVDGTMAGLNTAPQDPVFYAHHCYIDYVWNLFRRQQKARGINPANDYPPTNNSFHQPLFRMVGFEPLRNIDGYSNFWDEIVSYEDSPDCNDGNRLRLSLF